MRIIRAGEHIQHIPGYGMTVRESGVAVAASANWWEVSGKTCVAAYQPKGAATYAASKVNLANPGTYNATDGTAYPAWATGTGWTFTAASSQYLQTGVTTPQSDWTVLMQVASWSAGVLFGRRGSDVYNSPRWYILGNSSYVSYNHGSGSIGQSNVAPTLATGNVGMAAGQPYRNGSADGDAISATFNVGDPANLPIGALIRPTGVINTFMTGVVIAFAFWSDTLTTGEVATVSAAMAAL